jgi:hypothetical protein
MPSAFSRIRICFLAQLLEIQADHRLAEDEERDRGADQCVQHQHPNQRLRNRPQDAAESDQLQYRAHHLEQEHQGLLRERVHVVRDALVGVVDAVVRRQIVERAVAQVLGQEVVGQQTPPSDAEPVAHVVVKAVNRHGDHQRGTEHAHGVPEAV